MVLLKRMLLLLVLLLVLLLSPPVPSPTPSVAASELTCNAFWKTVGFRPADHSLATRSCCAPPELQCHHCPTSERLLFFTDCMFSPSATVGLLETSYDDTYEATSSSRARTLSKYSLEGAPLPLSPFSLSLLSWCGKNGMT